MSTKKGGSIKAPQMTQEDIEAMEDMETTEATDETTEDVGDGDEGNGDGIAKEGDRKKLRMKREPIMIASTDEKGVAIVDDKGAPVMIQKTMTVVIKLFRLSWDFEPLGVKRVVVLDESQLAPEIMEHAAHHGIGQWGTDSMALKKGATIREKADALYKNVVRIVAEKTWKAKRDPEAQKKALEKAATDGKAAGLTLAAETLVKNGVAKDLKAAYKMLNIVID